MAIRDINYFDEISKKQLPAVLIDLGEFTKDQVDKQTLLFKNTAFVLKVWKGVDDSFYNTAVMFKNEAGFKQDYINGLLLNLICRSL